MFFFIGDDCPIKSMKQVEPRLFLDDGWNQKSGIWYKGYSTECVLEDSIYDIVNGYQPAGKYCVICNSEVYHPILRGFPVYSRDDKKTNLKLDGYDIEIWHTPPLPKQEPILSLDEVSMKIGDILVENTKNFYKYNSPGEMTVIVSAGLDTHTVWAIQEQVSCDFTLSLHVPQPEDLTVLAYMGTRRDYDSDLIDKVSTDYWGYYHACYYRHLNWNNTGYYAETLTYRDGEAINAIARYNGKTIDTFASEDDYLYWFLKRPNVVQRYKDSDLQIANEAELKEYLWSTIWYDHQMWHLDRNMAFSPFFDVRIPELMNKLSAYDLARNCVTGLIQRNIIDRFRPNLLPLISDYKNEKDIWKNFRANFNESMIHPDTKLIYR